eukprot:750034-Hanusia_phi.AAC.1
MHGHASTTGIDSIDYYVSYKVSLLCFLLPPPTSSSSSYLLLPPPPSSYLLLPPTSSYLLLPPPSSPYFLLSSYLFLPASILLPPPSILDLFSPTHLRPSSYILYLRHILSVNFSDLAVSLAPSLFLLQGFSEPQAQSHFSE